MATFLVDISGRSGSVVFADRRKNNSFEKFCILGEPDFPFEIVDVDPYVDCHWSGSKLLRWSDEIDGQFDEHEKEIEKAVLNDLHKGSMEDWMEPMLVERQKNSVKYVLLSEIKKMISLAKLKSGTIVFLGD